MTGTAENIKGQQVASSTAAGVLLVVLGAAESGIGAAILGKQKGYKVFVSDAGVIKEKYRQELIDNAIEFEEGKHTEEKILSAAEVVKSPGIPEKNEMVKKIRAKGIQVISEIELAFRFKGDSKIIAITGSNGKSTTTTMIYHVCKTGGLDCALVGNIGYSFAKQVAENPKPLYVAEISSFQLDDIKSFRPDVAVLLNITEDHLDRYEYKFENYIKSKFRIIENQQPGDYFIYCDDDDVINGYLKTASLLTNPIPFSMKHEINNGAYIKNDQMMIRVLNERISMSIYDFAVKEKHNQYNTMAAGLSGAVIGVRKDKIREAIMTYKGLEHRMEHVAKIRGVEFINDSKATNINSTWSALDSMQQPVILILGGIDKGNDYSILYELVAEKVKAIVCMGVDNAKIHAAFDGRVEVIKDTASARDAVQESFKLAQQGDAVLLSPACASFDLFNNYEDRGRQFKDAVKEL
ncbi:MAG TPA: UDP-N-acetylmuramoyl-L-alanine--D-glutamate ligase [Chitinophagaceae bacterium]|nr:UDP-N-acetylmuramoyl-L-alanine--D-glutamate ligase [Chitinophagaceae bacterium]